MAGITFEAIDEGYKKMSYKINKTKKENKNKIIVNIKINPTIIENIFFIFVSSSPFFISFSFLRQIQLSYR